LGFADADRSVGKLTPLTPAGWSAEVSPLSTKQNINEAAVAV